MRILQAVAQAVALFVVSLAMAGCSTYAAAGIPEISAGSAVGHTELEGVRIGARPYQDFDAARRIFGQSPMENGILPILLVVENTSEIEIELTRVRIELQMADGKRLEPLDRMSAAREAAELATPPFLGVFPTTDTRAMVLDWAIKCLPDSQVCKRGRVVRRFLFYPVGKPFAEHNAEQCALIVPFEHADRSRRQAVKIQLSIEKRRRMPAAGQSDAFDFDTG